MVVVWSALCFAAAYVSPVRFDNLALFSLTTPFAIVANILFIIFWLLLSGRKWRALISVVTLVLCSKVFLMVFGLNFFGSNDATHHDRSIKIMSWNVHGMGIFERGNEKETAKRIMQLIKEQDADVLCLPEFYTKKNDSMKPYAPAIIKQNGFSEYKFCFDNTLGHDIYLGTAIFSKFPIEHYQVYHLGTEWINIVQCDIRVPGNKLMSLFCMHMHSFDLSDADKNNIEAIKQNPKDHHSGLRNFVAKFNYAYKIRATEADTTAMILKQSQNPVIVCGDFNDLPGSYTYTTIRGKLKDAFLEKGSGIGRTYNELSPTIRIDQMLFDPKAYTVTGFKSVNTRLSDHRPIIGCFELQ